MRAVELVSTAGQKITAPVLHIHQRMRRIGHRIHETERPHCFSQSHGTLHIVDSAQRIRSGTHCHQSRARCHLSLEIIPVQLSACRVQPYRTQHETTVLGDGLPRPAVGVMVQVRHDNLVARLQTTPDGTCQMERERGHVGAEDYFVRCAVQEIRIGLACGENDGIRLHAGGEGPMRIGVVVEQIVGDGRRHTRRHLRTAGPIEIRHRMPALLALQCRKVRTDGFDSEHGHGVFTLRCGSPRSKAFTLPRLRNTARCTLPVAVFGKASTTST